MAATARTLNELLFGALDRAGSRPVAMRAKRDGEWYGLSYRELADRIQDLSLGLLELGVNPGDRVAILSENRPEWAIADYACLTACCTDVPIYPTLPAKQVEHNLSDSGSVAVFVVDPDPAGEGAGDPGAAAARSGTSSRSIRGVAGAGVLTLDQVYDRGRAARPRHPTWRADALQVKPDDLATLIYTSGTTGRHEGRDADPRQHHLQRHHLLHPVQLHRQRRVSLVPARCRTSSSGCSGTTA